jgi:hypothetical protein
MGQGGLGPAEVSIGVATISRLLHRRHAAVAGQQLLTRDSRRYRTYFPSVAIIAPVRT